MDRISKAKIKHVQSLKHKKYRVKYEQYALEGDRACRSMIDNAMLPLFAVISTSGTSSIYHDATFPCYEADDRTMKTLSSLTSATDIIAVFPLPPKQTVDDIPLGEQLVLFLDRIQDPGNLGTILRTADWFGVEYIVLNQGNADPYNPKVLQAAKGSHGALCIVDCEFDALEARLSNHIKIGLDMNGHSISSLSLGRPMILTIGNEGQGLAQTIKASLDYTVSITGAKKRVAESLNAGIAGAIALDRLTEKLRQDLAD